MLRAISAAVLACAFIAASSETVLARAPTYTTGGRSQPKVFQPSWRVYQNYRGTPGYNVRRRSDERRWAAPQYRATYTPRLYQY